MEDERIKKALGIAFDYGQIDGNHHKTWVIDQIVRILTGDSYERWVDMYEHGEEEDEEYDWDIGIVP